MIDGVLLIENFIENDLILLGFLLNNVRWDSRMVTRKTASFGVAYNYSQMEYPYQAMPLELQNIAEKLAHTLGFLPNNCLINYYPNGKSKMGYHADRVDNLAENTGIAIVSLGETRSLVFKNIANPSECVEYVLPSGSLVYMTQEVQALWHHAIPKTNTENGRLSLTFRHIIEGSAS